MALETGKFFDMMGYDGMAMLQSVADDHVRFVVLHNGSSHVLLAEVHACSEATEKMMEPGKLVAAYPYGATDDDWKVAYRLATVEAMRLAGISPAATYDGVDTAPPTTERERLSAIAQHVEPRD